MQTSTQHQMSVLAEEMAIAGYNAMRDPATNLPAPWIVLGTAFKVFEAMLEVSKQELKPMFDVANAVTEQKHNEALTFPAKAAGVVSEYEGTQREGENALRSWSYEIARGTAVRAAHCDGAPEYLPKTLDEAKAFVPHEWVLWAIREAVMRTLAAPPSIV